MDINYFTFADRNATHCYVASGCPRTKIWIDTDDMILDESVFDYERTFYFIYYMSQSLPDAHFELHEKIWQLMISKLPKELWLQLVPKTTECGGTIFNHHLHMHIYFEFGDGC